MQNECINCCCLPPPFKSWSTFDIQYCISFRYNIVIWNLYTLHACMLSCFSHVRLFVTLCTMAHQAPLSMGFSRQSGLPWPSLEELPSPGNEPTSPAFQVDYLPLNHQRNPLYIFWIASHAKPSNHLLLCKLITILLTIFPMFYIVVLWLVYFITGSLYLLIPFIYFASPTLTPLATY